MQDDALPSYKVFQLIQKSIDEVLSKRSDSHAYFDYYRSKLGRRAYQAWAKGRKPSTLQIQAYLSRVVKPYHSTELNKKIYDSLLKNYGLSVLKLSFIDSNLKKWLESAKKDEMLLSVGGACALESIDLKRIDKLLRITEEDSLMRQYLDGMLLRYPTFTQISGAIIPSNGVNVFYDETYPWWLKISQYGVTDSQLITQRIYDHIYSFVHRFIKLQNPQNILIRIPFTQLNLVNNGQLKNWYKVFQKYIKQMESGYKLKKYQFKPNLNEKSWLDYTYNGPEILPITLNLIKRNYPELYQNNNMDRYTIHVRGKQIEHFDVDRHNDWIHKLLLNKDDYKSKRLQRILQKPMHRYGVAMYMWVRDHLEEQSSIGAAGFIDLQYKGKFLFEDEIFEPHEIEHLNRSQLIKLLLDSPLRLHCKNLPDFFKFLELFKSPYSVNFSKQLVINLKTLNAKAEKFKKKIAVLDKFIEYSKYFISILPYLNKKKQAPLTVYKKKNIIKILTFLGRRYMSYQVVIDSFPKKMSQEKLSENLFISALIFDKGKVSINLKFSTLMKSWLTLLKRDSREDIVRSKKYNQEFKEIKNMIKKYSSSISEYILKQRISYLTNHVNILPLVDNLFVSYMKQLLFIPSIRDAYLDIVSIEQDLKTTRDEKERKIIAIIGNVFDTMQACITYVMKNDVPYPWKERFETRYRRPY